MSVLVPFVVCHVSSEVLRFTFAAKTGGMPGNAKMCLRHAFRMQFGF